jgi:hypothetical protein
VGKTARNTVQEGVRIINDKIKNVTTKNMPTKNKNPLKKIQKIPKKIKPPPLPKKYKKDPKI